MMRLRASKLLRNRLSTIFMRLFLMSLVLGVWGVHRAYAGLTVTPTSWNVVGLDSNNTSTGPDTFEIGARVYNTGGTAVTNIVGDFVWDITNIYLNLSGASTLSIRSLTARAGAHRY